jgi:hypothetical protein
MTAGMGRANAAEVVACLWGFPEPEDWRAGRVAKYLRSRVCAAPEQLARDGLTNDLPAPSRQADRVDAVRQRPERPMRPRFWTIWTHWT